MAREHMYWPWTQLFPELDRFQTTKDAARSLRRAMIRSGSAELLVVVVGTGPLLLVFEDHALIPDTWFRWLFLPLWFVIPWVILWFFRGHIRKRLRKVLAKNGVPICVNCAYDLRGQTEPRCPECGQAVE